MTRYTKNYMAVDHRHMKRILIITHHFLPEVNGTAIRVYEIARHLLDTDANIYVHILAPVPSRPFGRFKQVFRPIKVEKVFNNRITVFRIWNLQPQLTDPPTTYRIQNYLLFPLIAFIISIPLILIDNVIIIVTPPTPVCIFAIVAKLFRKKVIVDITDLWHEEAEYLGYVGKRYRPLNVLSRGLELLSIKISKLVTVASRTIMRYYAKIFPHKDIVFLPTPIDTFLIDKYCTKDLIPDNRENIIIYAGNFGKPQALHLALLALAVLKQSKVPAKLMLIGGGEEENKLRKLIVELKLNEHVKLLAPLPRQTLFGEYYKKAKVGLVPLAFSKALIYAIPTKLYEYLACGLPFVSYGSSLELKYIALVSKAGIHVRKKDVTEIAKALEYVIDRYEQLSRNAKLYFINLVNAIEHALRMLIELT